MNHRHHISPLHSLTALLTCLLLLTLPLTAVAQTVHYAKAGMKTTLRLGWNSQNYGTIQWQQSTDGGQSWADISGATDTEYSTTLQQTDMWLRVCVNGDAACEPIVQTHLLRPVHTGMEKGHLHQVPDGRHDDGQIVGPGLGQGSCCRIGVEIMGIDIGQHPLSGLLSDAPFTGNGAGNRTGGNSQLPGDIMDRQDILILF